MSEPTNELGELSRRLEFLQTAADRARLKLALAKLEARDAWHDAQARLDRVRGQLGLFVDEAREPGEEILRGLRTLLDEAAVTLNRIVEGS